MTRKALALGLKPIVVVNKIDRPGARPDYAINATFDLFDKLGATEEQLDFPIIYASGLSGYAGLTEDVRSGDMRPLFDAILKYVPQRDDDADAPLQMQIISLDYSSYVGKIGGAHQPSASAARSGAVRPRRQAVQDRNQVGNSRAGAGWSSSRGERNIVLINSIEDISISCTIMIRQPEPLPMLRIDGPLDGLHGEYVASGRARGQFDQPPAA